MTKSGRMTDHQEGDPRRPSLWCHLSALSALPQEMSSLSVWKNRNLKTPSLQSCFLLKIYLTDLKYRVTKRGRDYYRSSFSCFTPQMSATATSETGAPCGSPSSVAGTQGFGPSSASFPASSAGTWFRSRTVGTRNWHSDTGCQHLRRSSSWLQDT